MTESIILKLNVIGWDAIQAIAGIVIAILGFVISSSLRRREKRAERYTLLAEYRREIIAFSREFFELVSQALSTAASSRDSASTRVELETLSTRLSGLADTGRFLFPNDNSGVNAFGTEKGPAFEGMRRPALDAILAAHYAVEAMIRDDDVAERYLIQSLIELRKTKQPLTAPVREKDPTYLLVQSRRCYLNVVVPDTFPREWLAMFTTLLGPLERDASS